MVATSLLISLGGLFLMLGSCRALWRMRSPSQAFPLGLMVIACASILNEAWFSTTTRIAIFGVLAAAISAATILLNVKRLASARVPGRQLLFVALPLWLFVVDALNSHSNSVVAVFGRLLPALIMTCALPLAVMNALTPRHVALILTFGFGFASALTLASPTPWAPCTTFKCSQFGSLFNGAFPSGNYIAAAAAVGCIAAATLRHNPRVRWGGIALSLIVLYVTDSRTSQLALAVATAACIGYHLWIRARLHLNALAAYAIVAGFSIAGIEMVYTADPTAFSNRGGIWRLGVEAIGNHWIFGRGISTWTTDVLARNYMHSEALLLLYGGGVVAVILYGLVVVKTLRALSPDLGGIGAAIAAFVLFRGLTEIAWNPLAFDGSTFLIMPLLMISGIAGVRSDQKRSQDSANTDLRVSRADTSYPFPSSSSVR